ncbi:hypothetical protein Acsp03_71830 [Actinomadura sp. NBRC 104412]|nr:hypothetical protein Acsp03_71830 [Actinomadura sp. NBRC 104412]
MLGPALVVVDQPMASISALRKQWIWLCRILQREWASLLSSPLKEKLGQQIDSMKSLRFVAASLDERSEGDVYLRAPDDLHGLLGKCRTVYLCVPLNDAQFEEILNQLSAGAALVDRGSWLDNSN